MTIEKKELLNKSNLNKKPIQYPLTQKSSIVLFQSADLWLITATEQKRINLIIIKLMITEIQ